VSATIGRIVHYRLSAADAEQVNRRRTAHAPSDVYGNLPPWPACAQRHVGNAVHEGQTLPCIITQVWPNEYGNHEGVNGQVLLDGSDSLWVTSRKEGTEPGEWSWPPRS